MYTANYPEKRTFEKFDKEHYIVYLSEEPVTYSFSVTEADMIEKIEGFSYTGNQLDGGTKIKATEATYNAFVSGLIRVNFSVDEVEALQANMLEALRNRKHPRAKEFSQRWKEFQTYRDECKEHVRKILNL